MTTYVLGAGASLHARYPLANDLGHQVLSWVCRDAPANYMWRGYLKQLNDVYGGLGNLEQILTELYECPAGSRAEALGNQRVNILGALKVAIPEFFNCLQHAPLKAADNYRELARRGIIEGDVILTFNYDLACERALRAEQMWEIGDGYGFSLGDRITPESRTKVLKLHGSVNWLGILFGGNMGYAQASSAYGPRPCLFGTRYFAYLGYRGDVHDVNSEHISKTGGDPALILPTLHKNFFHQTTFGREWETFWNDLWWQAKEALGSANRVVIIGYSLPCADERARELLLRGSNKDAEVCIFCGNDTPKISELFRSNGFKRVSTTGRSYFEDFLAS